MLIDWFTVGAQVLNFVVLVWLMKRFLYQPVLNAIAAREKRIADQIADAAAKERQATAERQAFKDKNTAFDQQRASLLEKATASAKAQAQQLADEAQTAALALAAQRQQALATQAQHLQQLIAGRAAQEVFAVARKTLTDLANVSLEERMVKVFTQRLGELAAPAKDQLGAALKQSTAPARVRSHFDLPADQQAAVQNAINVAFSAEVPLRFETAADTVCGIELSAGGQKLAWTITEYLRDLEHGVAELLAPPASPESPDAPRPGATPAPHSEAAA
ncbi:F0F1 ATP synthase subunit B family protein [Rhodoferax antarcticus]|uniref:ATP synthase subunit b n=1 Tax=Rhodoferax antarcticus ANT.BR TaxID=1111071 RepID=A0A1Q8YEQ3_9BURK|nr:F0F1 ATP synthase subunit B [Rhodoferax antarcticus]APW46250.1 F0F1 ATP synthase subunit B [Rhodoferax antarcticus]MCW2313060.1 F-type H+-transporting ATPase subunit b [Rhodoferax antarcticus]OLP06452.1 alternate ATP synthase F0, B subunit [Rhodoferax antarcticus ANT.BR]